MSITVPGILKYLRHKSVELESALAPINQFFSNKTSKLPRAEALLTGVK
jgi:hypothetical protein